MTSATGIATPPPARLSTWALSPAARVALGLGAVIALIQAVSLLGIVPARFVETLMSACTAMAGTLGLISAFRLVLTGAVKGQIRFSGLYLGGACILAIGISSAILIPSAQKAAIDFRSLTDFAGVALVAAAVLILPTRRISREEWIAALLDLATVLLAGFLAFWLFALNAGDVHALPVWPDRSFVYGLTLASLTIIGGLLLLLFRRHSCVPHALIGAMAIGATVFVAVEIVPMCYVLSTQGTATEPTLLGWAALSLGATIACDRARLTPCEINTEAPNALVAVPFAATCLFGFLLFASLFTREAWNHNASTLLPAMFVALGLIVARQTFVAKEKMRMVRDLTRAKEVAESANAARLHFLANISHDLRTPLNGILGCAQILLRDKGTTAKQRELLKTSQSCAEHLRNLINDLLDLSKLDSGRLELAPVPFDLRAFLSEVTRTFLIQAEGKSINLDVETPGEIPHWITADRKRLQQILGNLIHNAIKFTQNGGVTVRVHTLGRSLCFEIRDSGCGIMPDRLADLFKPFQTLDEKSIQLEGTGLGLSIAKKLAQKMGGDLNVQSVVGKGSTFSVNLPLVLAEPVVETQRTVVDYQGRRRRVLIVDDKPENRVVLRAILEPLDFLINEADSGEAALEQVRFVKPDFAILDLMMPGMDGFELCRRIHVETPAPVPVCFALSAMAGEDVTDRCKSAGFSDFLRKPLSLDVLLHALETHAEVEWVYGLIKPTPAAPRPALSTREITKVPTPEVLGAMIDLARRGYVRNLELQFDELAATDAELAPFLERSRRYIADFKLKELADWLTTFTERSSHAA